MSPFAVFALGAIAGAGAATLLYVSLAPTVAERATFEAITAGASSAGIPPAFAQGLAGPISRRVGATVARRVAPWVLS